MLSWWFSSVCCRGYSARCVVADIQLVVLSCCVRHRMAETSGISIWEREWRLFCLLPQVCDVICSLVRLSVSENSSVAPCGCVMAGPSRGLRGVAETTTLMTPALIINVLCQKWRLLRALQMCCTGWEVVVDAYQTIVSLWWICKVSVCVVLEYFCPSIWNGVYCPTPKIKRFPMSGGEDRGDDGLGIRKYRVEAVFRCLLPHCVRCEPQSWFTLAVGAAVILSL